MTVQHQAHPSEQYGDPSSLSLVLLVQPVRQQEESARQAQSCCGAECDCPCPPDCC